MPITKDNRLTAELVKENLIILLREQGYNTYANRLAKYRFIIADRYHGWPVEIAAMSTVAPEIIVNPDMLDEYKIIAWNDDENQRPYDKMLNQLSVLIRHELLHFFLKHAKRFKRHLAKLDPEWEELLRNSAIHDLANKAEDYEISIEGYDDYDKEVVRNMTLNNIVVGGLIAEDDHPEWGNKTMEEMFDLLAGDIKKLKEKLKKEAEEAEKNKIKAKVKEISHSDEYTKMYNKIISILDDESSYTDGDLATILADALAEIDVTDPVTGELLLSKGE